MGWFSTARKKLDTVSKHLIGVVSNQEQAKHLAIELTRRRNIPFSKARGIEENFQAEIVQLDQEVSKIEIQERNQTMLLLNLINKRQAILNEMKRKIADQGETEVAIAELQNAWNSVEQFKTSIKATLAYDWEQTKGDVKELAKFKTNVSLLIESLANHATALRMKAHKSMSSKGEVWKRYNEGIDAAIELCKEKTEEIKNKQISNEKDFSTFKNSIEEFAYNVSAEIQQAEIVEIANLGHEVVVEDINKLRALFKQQEKALLMLVRNMKLVADKFDKHGTSIGLGKNKSSKEERALSRVYRDLEVAINA